MIAAGPGSEVLPYYVMPFVEGETLRERLARTGQLAVPEVVRLTGEIADALAKAHKVGVVHRDIKPENILLADGHALVMDFGIAKAVSDATGRQGLTSAGMSLGTPAYMAPEQVAADPRIDHRADLYSPGVGGVRDARWWLALRGDHPAAANGGAPHPSAAADPP